MPRQIPLTRGYVTTVDDEDYHWLVRFKWCAGVRFQGGKKTVIARRAASRSEVSGTRFIEILMHRLIMGEPEGLQVDHCNGDTLDNRKENLRLATPTQNMVNQRLRSDNATSYKGVSADRRRGGFNAFVTTPNHNTKNLGHFKTAEEAALAYDEAARALHGTFARYNFPRDGEQSCRN
jgi:hypothetical protein